MDGIPFGFRQIAFIELFFISDFYYLEAFLYKVGRELPEFFEHAVRVHNDRKVFFGVVCCNSEIVCHCVFLLCGKFLDSAVGVRQPYFVDVVQNVFARFVVVLTVALQDFMVAKRVFERNERRIGLLLFADKEDERFLADKTLVIVHPSYAVI